MLIATYLDGKIHRPWEVTWPGKGVRELFVVGAVPIHRYKSTHHGVLHDDVFARAGPSSNRLNSRESGAGKRSV
jgi:hypothetical protein